MHRTARHAALLALALTVVAAPPAAAQDCQFGTRLASTLLIPYFEVDPADPAGLTTLFSVTNEANVPTLVRVILWTDWGMPTLGFDVYLERFDVQTFNLRDLFLGNLPSTGQGSPGLDDFPGCDALESPPFHLNPALNANQQAQLLGWHRGTGGPLDPKCAGENHGDSLARGYITVDVVDQCSGERFGKTATPAAASYFVEGGGSAGTAIAANRIWGDFLIVDPANDFAQGSQAVGIWADPARFGPPEFTFYGRFHSYDAQDERAPLPTLWASRFLQGGAFTGGTELVVWRDVGTPEADAIPCGGEPSWHPLPQGFVTARDESASEASRVDVGDGKPNLFPLATQKVPASDFGLPYAFGRVQMGLGDGPFLTNPRQAWVQTLISASGRFSVGFDARAIDELCDEAAP